MRGSSERRAYAAGVAVALLATILSVWTTLVRDDGTGIGYFMIILATAVGWFSAWFEPGGMARTMIGVAIMQVLLGVAVATAPLTAATPDGPSRVLLFSGFFTALWLLSATFFRIASKGDHQRRARAGT